MSIWEVVMLMCFGASWPFNLAKTWRQKSTVGKSPVFLVLIVLGYAAGIVHKIVNQPDGVLALWIAIELMVAADLVLFLTYRRRERRTGPVANGNPFPQNPTRIDGSSGGNKKHEHEAPAGSAADR